MIPPVDSLAKLTLFGALAGVIAYLLFRERLARVQLAGVATIVVGVGILSALRA